jgi:hypothetical protein
MAAIIYGIWYARNQKKIEDKDFEDDRVINNATISIKEYQLATQATSDELNKAIIIRLLFTSLGFELQLTSSGTDLMKELSK